MNLRGCISSFLHCDYGMAATEYAVMTSMILGGLLLMITAFGEAVTTLYVAIRTAFAG
ncbi:MAG: hypothetical protein ACE5HE_02550 [Phycisphaerae bacterium]